MRAVLRITGTVLVFLLAGLALPVGFGGLTVAATFDDLHPPANDHALPAPTPAAYDPGKPTAAVVVGTNGAAVSDVLAPYEILATTGAFNVYVVAPTRRPSPLTGGLDLAPDLTFAELDHLLGDAVADVVVVPALPDVGQDTTKPVTDWVRQQAARGSLLVSVCNGSGVLASAGLLDGRDATAHWFRINSFEEQFPAVHWVRGKRYIDEGNLVSTAGILSGIDGTLRVVERLTGPAAAARAAEAIGWRHYSPGTEASMVQAHIGPEDVVAGVNAAFGWDRPTVGVLLTNGVGETELASVFDTYGQSLAARTLSVTADGAPVRSRHGLTFVPRANQVAVADDLDRLIVPGAEAARSHAAAGSGLEPVYLHHGSAFPFEAVLQDLARTTDTATAQWTAKSLEYPTDDLAVTGSALPWTLILRPIGLAALGVLVALGLIRLSHIRRRARQSSPG
jgi:putative intracellular protease/amidase